MKDNLEKIFDVLGLYILTEAVDKYFFGKRILNKTNPIFNFLINKQLLLIRVRMLFLSKHYESMIVYCKEGENHNDYDNILDDGENELDELWDEALELAEEYPYLFSATLITEDGIMLHSTNF